MPNEKIRQLCADVASEVTTERLKAKLGPPKQHPRTGIANPNATATNQELTRQAFLQRQERQS